MTAAILCGGKSKRFGEDKALFKIDNTPLFEVVYRKIKDLFSEIIIVSKKLLPFSHMDVTLAKDIYDAGPLGAIYTALFYAKSERVFVIGCDMPFINPELVKFFIDYRKTYDLLMAKTPDGLQPLFSIYTKRCLPKIKLSIERGNFKISSFIRGVKTVFLESTFFSHIDKELLTFFNINTKSDLKNIEDRLRYLHF